jgi:hypothetical protein
MSNFTESTKGFADHSINNTNRAFYQKSGIINISGGNVEAQSKRVTVGESNNDSPLLKNAMYHNQSLIKYSGN